MQNDFFLIVFADYILPQVPFLLKQGLHKLLGKSVTELHCVIACASNCIQTFIARNELVIKHSALLNHKLSY